MTAGNTNTLRKGKYPCTADLLFYWSVFNQARESVDNGGQSYRDTSPYEVSEYILDNVVLQNKG